MAAKNVLANVELCRDQAKSESELPNTDFKGVLYPWPILFLFMHFSWKSQHIGDK